MQIETMIFMVLANLGRSFGLLIFSISLSPLFEKCHNLGRCFLNYYQRSLMVESGDYAQRLFNEYNY